MLILRFAINFSDINLDYHSFIVNKKYIYIK